MRNHVVVATDSERKILGVFRDMNRADIVLSQSIPPVEDATLQEWRVE